MVIASLDRRRRLFSVEHRFEDSCGRAEVRRSPTGASFHGSSWLPPAAHPAMVHRQHRPSTMSTTCSRASRTIASKLATRQRPSLAANVTTLTSAARPCRPEFRALGREASGRMVRFPENAMAPSFAAAGKASVGPAA